MSLKKISERKYSEFTSYAHIFNYRGEVGWGFMFDCDSNGNPVLGNPDAVENYRKCVSGEIDVIDCGVEQRTHRSIEPARGLCDCGEEVVLSRFTNTCECGADYCMSGNRLAPRDQWGEETGEHYSDILGV